MFQWLAKKIAPKAFRDAERYFRLMVHVRNDKQWLSEFPDVSEAMHRLEMIDRDYWRPLGEPHSGYRFESISAFREELRRRHPT